MGRGWDEMIPIQNWGGAEKAGGGGGGDGRGVMGTSIQKSREWG